jgi:hypothetical protein
MTPTQEPNSARELLFVRLRLRTLAARIRSIVSDRGDSEEVARLERLNEELSESLKRCRTLLHDYEVRVTANSNEARDEGKDTQQA